MIIDDRQVNWDAAYDCVIVGYGYAGALSAILCADLGFKVLLIEKMQHPGGISIMSGGGIRTSNHASSTLAYLRETCGGRTEDIILAKFAEKMTHIPQLLKELCKINHSKVLHRTYERDGDHYYPFSGYKSLESYEVIETPGFDAEKQYPHVRGDRLKRGLRLFNVLEQNVKIRPIDVQLNCKAERILQNHKGDIIGLQVDHNSTPQNYRLNKAVILACGGFEADEEFKKQHFQAQPVLPLGFEGNTGDGLRMAQQLGADLWHMWHYHGSYGFRHPSRKYKIGIRPRGVMMWVPGEDKQISACDGYRTSKMTWINLDQNGQRFMNEYPPYLTDTGARPLDHFCPQTQSFPRIPAWFLSDEAGRKLQGQWASVVYNDLELECLQEWDEQNLNALETGVIKKFDSLEQVAMAMNIKTQDLQNSIDKWNRDCETGADTEFSRPASSMHPISDPPYYLGQLWPCVANTQGGLRHDENWQVVDSFGSPISRLYAAGEISSLFGHLYLSCGNISDCFVGAMTIAQQLQTKENHNEC